MELMCKLAHSMYLVYFAGPVRTLGHYVLASGVPRHALDVRNVSRQHERVARGQANNLSLVEQCDSNVKRMN